MIQVVNLFKIYGKNAHTALIKLRKGASRDQLLNESGNLVAVNDVSFRASAEIFVIMGLSGSGKSTLLRCINRLIESTGGHVNISNPNCPEKLTCITTSSSREMRNIRRFRISMVFQNFGLFPNRDVVSNVYYGLEVGRNGTRKERYEKAHEAIEAVGLKGWEESRIYQLSGGMKQRVGLARALVTDAEVLLMDEPFSALDPLIRTQLQNHFLQIVSQRMSGKTVIFVTHDLQEAMKLGTRIAIMEAGTFVQIGSPEEIILAPKSEYVRNFIRDVNPLPVIRIKNLTKSIESDSSCDRCKPLQKGASEFSFFHNNDKLTLSFFSDQGMLNTAVVNGVAIPVENYERVWKEKITQVNDSTRERILCLGSHYLLEDAIMAKSLTKYPLIIIEDRKFCGIVTDEDIFRFMV